MIFFVTMCIFKSELTSCLQCIKCFNKINTDVSRVQIGICRYKEASYSYTIEKQVNVMSLIIDIILLQDGSCFFFTWVIPSYLRNIFNYWTIFSAFLLLEGSRVWSYIGFDSTR